jgi:hypothetical protein
LGFGPSCWLALIGPLKNLNDYTNKNKVNGHPYHTPHSISKSSKKIPLILTFALTLIKKIINHGNDTKLAHTFKQ